MAGRRQERAAATRASVLDAARCGFNTTGFERTGMRDIARLAGVTTGAVFAHFDSKEALYREVYGHAPVSASHGRALLLAARLFVGGADRDGGQMRAVLAIIEEA